MVRGLARQLRMEPRWRDLPALSRVQNRRFGLPASVRESAARSPAGEAFAAMWSTLVMPTHLALVILDRLMGTLAAVDRHAVMRITPTGTGYRRRYAALFALVGLPLMGGLAVLGALPFAGLSLVIGQAWPLWAATAVVLGVPAVDVIVSSNRIARTAPRARGAAKAGAGGADHVAGSVAAWPPKSGSGTRLIRDLLAACEALSPVTVDFYARPHLVDFYRGFGFSALDTRVGLMRCSVPPTAPSAEPPQP